MEVVPLHCKSTLLSKPIVRHCELMGSAWQPLIDAIIMLSQSKTVTTSGTKANEHVD